jgi:hypothetical protein
MRAWQRSDATSSGEMSAVGLIGLLGLFAGLCTILALVATIADVWREHVQQGWPVATATIQHCSVDPYLRKRVTYHHIDCKIGYLANGEQTITRIRSRNTVVDAEIHAMNLWIAQHARGAAMEIHYDPADARNAVLTATDMPEAGPRTPNNVRLLLIALVACVVMLTTAKLLSGRAPDAAARESR